MLVKQKVYTINPTEFAHFVLFSLLVTPPNFLWQSWLEAQFPGYTDKLTHTQKEKLVDDAVTGSSNTTSAEKGGDLKKRFTASDGTINEQSASSSPVDVKKKLNIKNTAAKFALDQTFGAAANTILFIAGIALLRGHSWESVQQQTAKEFWPMIFAGQKLWPLVSVLSFTVVPFEQRTLFGSTVGLFWGIYLSIMSGGKK